MIRYGAATLLLMLAPAATVAQPVLVENEILARIGLIGESSRTARRLAAADKLQTEGKWTEAVDAYQQLLTEAGDELVPLDARHALQARRLCYLRLAALPPAALRIYRSHVDVQAKKWLDEGRRTRDRALLRRLVEEAFCSQYTDRALDLLGDLAFERGDFEAALRWWRMLSPLPLPKEQERAVKDELVFPTPTVDPAQVQAKQIMARWFRGEHAGGLADLAHYRGLYPNAQGWLAGQQGNYIAILQKLAEDDTALVAPASEEAWPTFAGAPERNGILARTRGILGRLSQVSSPQWMVRLDTRSRIPVGEESAAVPGRVVSPSREARSLASYPVIAGDRVLVADSRYVTAYHLATGQRVLEYDLSLYHKNEDANLTLKLPFGSDLSYTLAIAGDRAFARLGGELLGAAARKGDDGGENHSFLVCINLHPDPAGRIERWSVPSRGSAAAGPMFEGSPMVSQGRVYIAESRTAGGQVQTGVACYDADNGSLRWQCDVCSTPEAREGERRDRHLLLTLAGPNVVYCSHSGAIAALDAASGRHVWSVRYPSRGPRLDNGEPSPRSLAPCLYAGGRLFVAPLDFDRLLCFDPETGHQLWESAPLEAVHLLGVAKGRLILTTITPAPSIRALDVERGNPLRSWLQPADGSGLTTFGRGLLAGDVVYWPTRGKTGDRLYVLNQEDGEPLSFAEGIVGNLAAANGCLVAAGTEYLAAYVPEGRMLKQRQEEADEDGASALARYRLALAKADVGREVEALADLDRALRLAEPDESWQGIPFRDMVGRSRREILLSAASRAREARRWEVAAALFDRAAAAEFPNALRLEALRQKAALWMAAGRPERAVAVWQAILVDAVLNHSQIVDAAGDSQPAALFAAERIDELTRSSGCAVYDPFEQMALELLNSAPGPKRKEVLDRLGREFPNASVTTAALLQLARSYEASREPASSAQAYRLLLRRGVLAPDRGTALAGLARAYEEQDCWPAARSIWRQLASELGDQVVPALDAKHPIRDFVSAQLQKSSYQETPVEVRLPLKVAWSSASSVERISFYPPSRDRQGAAAPVPPLTYVCDNRCAVQVRAAGAAVFSISGYAICCRDSLTGRPCWERACPFAPSWVDCHGDTVLAAGATGICSLRRANGEAAWEYQADALTKFRLAGSRLFCLQDERRLLALDVETGRVVWSAWAPGGRFHLPAPHGCFHPQYYADETGVVLQTSGGRCLVLDSRTGRKINELDTPREPWPRPPMALDERRVCVVTDPQHLVLLDCATEKEIWTHALEPSVSLTGEPPQVVAGHDALLVLACRNYGFTLECLDPLTGTSRWPEALFLGIKPADVETGAVDDSALYLAQQNLLQARRLTNGRLLWQQALPRPGSRWQVIRARNSLVVFPLDPLSLEFRWLSWTPRVIGVLPLEAPAGIYLPILICDPTTGRLIDRVNLYGDAHLPFQRGLPVGGAVPPVLISRSACPTVQISDRGIVVVLGNRSWGLKAGRPD